MIVEGEPGHGENDEVRVAMEDVVGELELVPRSLEFVRTVWVSELL